MSLIQSLFQNSVIDKAAEDNPNTYTYRVSLSSMWFYLLGNLVGSIIGGIIFKFNPERISSFASINKWYFVSESKYVEIDDDQSS